MKITFLIIILIFGFISRLKGQSRSELEAQRNKNFEEINYIDNLLKETSKEKKTGLNDLKIIGNKLNLRENVIIGLHDEIELLNNRIELNTVAIEMMEKDLVNLRREYAKTVINSFKSGKGNKEIEYILSAKDFNQGYKRLKYLQQAAKFRHQEAEVISELKSQVEGSKRKLENDLMKISDLKNKEEQQENLLQQEQSKKKKMINSLGSREKQLKKELEEKKKISEKIEKEIARIIEEEKRKNIANELTPEQEIIGENFTDNKGKLPWPVEKGIITSQFGKQQNPILSYVTEDNIGIDITSYGKTLVRSVFKGRVVAIFPISGANMSVIIRHGRYLTVYHNIVHIKVKTGEMIDIKQEIGEVFCDEENGNTAVLKFMIFEENAKYIDPELWIAKNR